jgi:hypothetical protein
MFRFLIRFIAVICLAVSVMFLVLDATRSLGVSELVFTPLEVSWRQFFPETLDMFSLWLTQSVHPFLSDPILVTLLTVPTFAVFAASSAVFYVIGYRKRRHMDGLAKR